VEIIFLMKREMQSVLLHNYLFESDAISECHLSVVFVLHFVKRTEKSRKH